MAYAPLHGAGGAVNQLTPTAGSIGDKEFDEDDVEFDSGARNLPDKTRVELVYGPRTVKRNHPKMSRLPMIPKKMRNLGPIQSMSSMTSTTNTAHP